MYSFYINRILYPVAPSAVTTRIDGKNKTYTLLDDNEINVLKGSKLKEISFDLLLPNSRYPFSDYSQGYHEAKYYIDNLEYLKTLKSGFDLTITRKRPNGELLYGTSMKVSLESLEVDENASNHGLDFLAKLKFKEYRDYGSKIVEVEEVEEKPQIVTVKETRQSDTPPQTNTTYTVKSGDTLFKIAKKFYGNGSQYTKIFNANRDKISNPDLIYPNQVLVIPQ